MRKKVPDVGVCALLLLYKRTVIRAVGTGRGKEKRAIPPPGFEQNRSKIPFRSFNSNLSKKPTFKCP